MPVIDNLLNSMVEKDASDLHLSTGDPPRFRIAGHLTSFPYPPFDDETLLEIVSEIAPSYAKDCIRNNQTTAFAYEMERNVSGRFRFNVYPTLKGIACAIRYVKSTPPRLSDLGLPRIVPDMIGGFQGLVLIIGATGSGKSTTLAACINEINSLEPLHVITLENPIEYRFINDKCLIHQREILTHVPDYTDGIENALQEDPDIIVIGEMRGIESIQLAITAAETGHLVFATLHANSASKAIERLISAFPAAEQGTMRMVLAENLKAVIGQKLIRTADKKNRVAAIEVLINNSSIATMIRDGETHQIPNVIQTSRKIGMKTLTESIAELMLNNIVDVEDALSKAPDVEELKRTLRDRGR